MPNVMATLPNIGGAVRSTPQNSADAHYYRVPCSNAAKTRNPLISVVESLRISSTTFMQCAAN